MTDFMQRLRHAFDRIDEDLRSNPANRCDRCGKPRTGILRATGPIRHVRLGRYDAPIETPDEAGLCICPNATTT